MAPLQKQPHTLINTLIHTKTSPLAGISVCVSVCVCDPPVSPLISRLIRDWRQQGVSVCVLCVCVCMCVCDWRRECEIGVIRQLTFKPPHLPCATPPTHTLQHLFLSLCCCFSILVLHLYICVCKTTRQLFVYTQDNEISF